MQIDEIIAGLELDINVEEVHYLLINSNYGGLLFFVKHSYYDSMTIEHSF